MTSSPPAQDLWRHSNYRYLWTSLLISQLAGQASGVAMALLAANRLQATPGQMGILGAMGTLPFVLLMLPAGVWLDRTRKLPVFLAGEAVNALALAAILVALALDRLSMELLYAVAFVQSSVSVAAGTAGQVVVTQVVDRHQLVDAHGKNRMATSLAEVAGPGLGGLLVKLLGFPLAMAASLGLMISSIALLKRLKIEEAVGIPSRTGASFIPELRDGLRFVFHDRRLLAMALSVGAWQVFQTCAMVTQVLFATRELGLDAFDYGLCLTLAGGGALVAGWQAHRLSRRLGQGPAMILGMAISGFGWVQQALLPAGGIGIAGFVVMQLCFSSSVVLIWTNMLAVRQAITPAALQARMTSTMRWLTLFPAWPGMLLGGYLAESFGIRAPIALGGLGALVLAAVLGFRSSLRSIRQAA